MQKLLKGLRQCSWHRVHPGNLLDACRPYALLLLAFSAYHSVVPVALAETAVETGQRYRIGVLAYKGKQRAIERWRAHGEYLSQRLAPFQFEIIPLGYKGNELSNAVINREIDFVITNPGHYTELELGGHVTHLATRRMAGPGGIIDQFGGTAITRPERTGINRYSDLAGKLILIPSRSSLGGWQTHLREALAQGVDLEREATIRELKDHTKVVEAILAGEGDVGFIRSDLYEQLVARGKLQPGQLKVVNPQHFPGYPYHISTQLYPEWPFARVSGTSTEVATRVLLALLSLQTEEAAARSAGLSGWTLPGNYSEVNDLFRETELGPYKRKPPSLSEILQLYWIELLTLSLLISVALLYSTIQTIRANITLRHDIEMRKRVEKELQLSSSVFENTHEGIVITDHNTRIIDINKAFSRITGYARHEAIGATPALLQSGQHDDQFYLALWQSLQRNGVWTGEITNRRKNGELYSELLTISAVHNNQGETEQYVGIFTDISDYKKTEKALRRSQKMEAIGQLTGGIAHDFNNLLTIILGQLELLQEEIDDSNISRERIDAIAKAGQRAAELTGRLLSFSRGNNSETCSTDINQLINGMHKLLSRSITPDIEIVTELTPELWQSSINPGAFEDTLLNLIINARDAMENRGTVTIRTRNTTLGSDYCSTNPTVTPGDYVEMVVSDTGKGISAQDQEHIFEPFFTTKEAGKGTGLGLAMTFSFVSHSGGHIECESELGKGTAFHLFLPRNQELPPSEGEIREPTNELPRGDETILLVDDEEALLSISRESLEAQGYRILAASTTAQALELLMTTEGIDLLFSDIILPGTISGLQLAKQAEVTQPGIKILLTTGSAGNIYSDSLENTHHYNLLRKPYTRAALCRRVRKVLDT